jgi:hypothetical protein
VSVGNKAITRVRLVGEASRLTFRIEALGQPAWGQTFTHSLLLGVVVLFLFTPRRGILTV